MSNSSFTLQCNLCRQRGFGTNYYGICKQEGCQGRYVYTAEFNIINPESSNGKQVEHNLALKEEYKKLLDENGSLESKVLFLERRVTDLNDDMEETFAVQDELNVENDRLHALVEEKTQELMNLNREIYEYAQTNIETTRRMESLEEGNADLTKTLGEVQKELLDLKDRNRDLKEGCETKDKKIIEMRREIDKMSAEVTWERVQHEEAQKQLEVMTKEKDELAEKLKNVTNNGTGNKLMEQIVETNFNLSAALAKLTVEGARKTIDMKIDEPSQQPEEPAKASEKPDVVVPCGTCGVRALIPEGKWMTHCKEASCSNSLSVILAPVQEGHKIVRRFCNGSYFCTKVPDTQTTLECRCCQREFEITTLVVEMRNNQKVYNAKLKVPENVEIQQLNNQLKARKEEHDCQLKTVEDELKKARDELHVAKEENREKLHALEQKNTELAEEMKMLQQEKKENSKQIAILERGIDQFLEDLKLMQNKKAEQEMEAVDLKKKLAHLNEINVLLMKKVWEDPSAMEKKLETPSN